MANPTVAFFPLALAARQTVFARKRGLPHVAPHSFVKQNAHVRRRRSPSTQPHSTSPRKRGHKKQHGKYISALRAVFSVLANAYRSFSVARPTRRSCRQFCFAWDSPYCGSLVTTLFIEGKSAQAHRRDRADQRQNTHDCEEQDARVVARGRAGGFVAGRGSGRRA